MCESALPLWAHGRNVVRVEPQPVYPIKKAPDENNRYTIGV